MNFILQDEEFGLILTQYEELLTVVNLITVFSFRDHFGCSMDSGRDASASQILHPHTRGHTVGHNGEQKEGAPGPAQLP